MYSNPTSFTSIQELLDSSKPYVPVHEFKSHHIYLKTPKHLPLAGQVITGKDPWAKIREDIWVGALNTAFVASFYKAKFVSIKKSGEPLVWFDWYEKPFPEIADESVISKALEYLNDLAKRYEAFIQSMENGEIDSRIYAPKNWGTASPSWDRHSNFLNQIGFEKTAALQFLRSLDVPSTFNDFKENPTTLDTPRRIKSESQKSSASKVEKSNNNLANPIKLTNNDRGAIDSRINSALRKIDLDGRDKMPLPEITNAVWAELTKAPISAPFTHYDAAKKSLRVSETESTAKPSFDKEALRKRLIRRFNELPFMNHE